MKKYTLFFCLVIGLAQSKAQHYNLFKPHCDYIYTDGKTVHFDSTYALGPDSVFLNYVQLNTNTFPNTYNRNNWFCSAAIKSSQNEWMIVYNYDSVFTFKPLTSVNNSWILYQFQNGNKIKATVDSVVFTTVISMDDSVKYISLQLTDSLNNNLSSNINQGQIHIAKNIGLIKFPLFEYLLGGWGSSIDLIGCSNPAIGFQNLTAYDVFNMEVGDEVISHQSAVWNPLSKLTRRKVISKTFVNNVFTYTDSVFIINQIDPMSNSLYTVVQNNLVTRVIDLNADNYKVWSNLCGSGIIDNYNNVYPVALSGYWSWESELCVQRKFQHQGGFGIDSLGTANESIGSFNTLMVYKGLGEIYYNPPFPNNEKYIPVYYKKGNETCGNWVNFQYLLTGINESDKDLPTFTVHPNPANSYIKINNPKNETLVLTIVDYLGKKVLETDIKNQSQVINVEQLSNGVYMVNLNNSFNSKLIINR
jgi:hypothetical protein